MVGSSLSMGEACQQAAAAASEQQQAASKQPKTLLDALVTKFCIRVVAATPKIGLQKMMGWVCEYWLLLD